MSEPRTEAGRRLLRILEDFYAHPSMDIREVVRLNIGTIEAGAETLDAQAHQPGDHHRYRIECEVCGQPGTIRLSVDPDLADLAVDVPLDSRPEEPPE